VFTFGIGNGVSSELIKGLAKAGEGFHEFIGSGESMEEKVLKQLSRALKPAFTDVPTPNPKMHKTYSFFF